MSKEKEDAKRDPNYKFLAQMKNLDDDPDFFDEMSEFEEFMEAE